MSDEPTYREFWTPPQLAARLGVDVGKVRAWIAAGELLAFDCSEPGSHKPRVRIREADFEAFLAKRAIVAPPPKQKRKRRG